LSTLKALITLKALTYDKGSQASAMMPDYVLVKQSIN